MNPVEMQQQEYLLALPTVARRAAVAVPAVPSPLPMPIRLNATVTGHHDVDTFYADIDLSVFTLHATRISIRLLGCAGRELRDPGGKEAAAMLAALPGMTVGSPVVLTAVKNDLYAGRLDALVAYVAADRTVHDLATDLIAAQWLVPWNGRGPQPKPPWPRTVQP